MISPLTWSTEIQDMPEKEQGFSCDALAAFRRRAKSIKHSGASIEFIPVTEGTDGEESPNGRLEVTIYQPVAQSKRAVIRVHIWDDRWLWVDGRLPSKTGWRWHFTTEGRFVSPGGAEHLVAMVERMLVVSGLSGDSVSTEMQLIWERNLAKGPKPILEN